MSTRTVTDHNAGVMREVADVASSHVTAPRDAWVHGFVVGIALAEMAPETARALRAKVESVVATGTSFSAEEVEVYLRSIADLFDRSLDS